MPCFAMQIVCPNCSTAYEIPDAVFGGKARKLRCETCGTQWRAGPPDAEAEPAAAPASPEQATQSAPAPVVDMPPMRDVGRVFGKPVDARAQAEFRQAMDREKPVAEHQAAPAGPAAPPAAAPPAAATADMDDPFINLVMAARSRAIEFEPEPPAEPRVHITSPAFLGTLLTLFVLSMSALLFLHR